LNLTFLVQERWFGVAPQISTTRKYLGVLAALIVLPACTGLSAPRGLQSAKAASGQAPTLFSDIKVLRSHLGGVLK
jgi:hypothetical protein